MNAPVKNAGLGGVLRDLPLTRIKLWIARALYRLVVLFSGSQPRVISRRGIRYEADLSEALDLSLFLFGGFQNHVSRNRFFQLKPDAVIVDVGANVGIMTLQFAQTCPAGKVFAFEPTDYAFKRLQRNLSLNPDLADRVIATQAFVSDSTSEQANLTAYSSWKLTSEAETDRHPVHGGTAHTAKNVGSLSLDQYLNSVPRVDFIKIDTDGHELEVLRGARETIRKHRPAIIFECGAYLIRERSQTFQDFADFFESLNYSLRHSKTGAVISRENAPRVIPGLSTIDILAVPN